MKNRSLLVLFSVIVVDLIGFGIVMPILPFYAAQFGAKASTLGLLLTSYAAAQFVFAPVWGRLSDKIGRRNVLAITLFAGGIALVVLGSATSLLWLFIGRTLSGVFAANIGVASAYVTDVTDEQSRTKGMGLIGAAFGVGFLIGPMLGGFLSPYGYNVPIFVAAALTGVNAVTVLWRIPEPTKHAEAARQSTIEEFEHEGRQIKTLTIMNFVYTAGLAMLETTLAFFLRDHFGYDAHHTAYLFALMAFVMVAIQGGLIRQLSKRMGDRALLIWGTLLLAASFPLVPATNGFVGLVIVLTISAMGRGFSQPALLSLVSRGAAPGRRGAVMGVFQSAASLSRVVAPAAAGALYDVSHNVVFYCGGVLAAIVLAMGMASIVGRQVGGACVTNGGTI